jgi:hypothetical protein
MTKKKKATPTQKQVEQVARAEPLQEQIDALISPQQVEPSKGEDSTKQVVPPGEPESAALSPRDFIQKRMAELEDIEKKGKHPPKASKKKAKGKVHKKTTKKTKKVYRDS